MMKQKNFGSTEADCITFDACMILSLFMDFFAASSSLTDVAFNLEAIVLVIGHCRLFFLFVFLLNLICTASFPQTCRNKDPVFGTTNNTIRIILIRICFDGSIIASDPGVVTDGPSCSESITEGTGDKFEGPYEVVIITVINMCYLRFVTSDIYG